MWTRLKCISKKRSNGTTLTASVDGVPEPDDCTPAGGTDVTAAVIWDTDDDQGCPVGGAGIWGWCWYWGNALALSCCWP